MSCATLDSLASVLPRVCGPCLSGHAATKLAARRPGHTAHDQHAMLPAVRRAALPTRSPSPTAPHYLSIYHR